MISGLGVDTVQKFGRPLYRDGVSQSLSKVGPTLRAGQCHRSLRPPSLTSGSEMEVAERQQRL